MAGMSGGCGKGRRAADQNTARVHLHRDRARTTLVLAQSLAGDGRDAPVMQRAGDAGVMHYALAERPMLMRAFIHQGIDLAIGGTENGDLFAALHGKRSRAKRGKLVNRTDIKPVSDHGSTSSNDREGPYFSNV